MKRWFSPVILLVILVLMIAGCGSEGPGGEGVLARVGSREITSEELDQRLQEIPSFAQAEFKGPEGRQRLLERLIQEEMMYQASLDAGLPDDPEVSRQLRMNRRRTLVDAYYRGHIEKAATLSDDAVEQYYLEHPDEFTEPEQARVRHILLERERDAQRLRQRLASGELDFAEAAQAHSEDERTKSQGGLIPGYVARERPVGSLGKLPDFVEAALALETGEISEVIETSKGHHILKLDEKTAARLRPLDEVRAQIQSRGSGERVRQKFEETMEELRERYHVRIFEEVVEEASIPGPRELFQLAQEARSPEERLEYYRRILEHHPDNDRCYEAQFMIGFIFSEDLGDLEQATEAFRVVLEEYPDCDLVESAQWMIDNMGREAPAFDDVEDEDTEG